MTHIPAAGAPGYGAATTDVRTKRYRCACGAETTPLTAAEPLPDGWRVLTVLRRRPHRLGGVRSEVIGYACQMCAQEPADA